MGVVAILAVCLLGSSGSVAVQPAAEQETTLVPGFDISDVGEASTYSFHGSAIQLDAVVKCFAGGIRCSEGCQADSPSRWEAREGLERP